MLKMVQRDAMNLVLRFGSGMANLACKLLYESNGRKYRMHRVFTLETCEKTSDRYYNGQTKQIWMISDSQQQPSMNSVELAIYLTSLLNTPDTLAPLLVTWHQPHSNKNLRPHYQLYRNELQLFI